MLTSETWHEQLCTNEFLTGFLADSVKLNWNPSQGNEAMYPRAASLDAAHQFTLSQGALEMVVSVAAVKGWPALYHVSEPGSCR
ncbi:MAG: hypothetical protein HN744_17440 [Halieaceae bacterium]|nr:hypothetical protein [Halieaceae bacterium]